MKGLMVFTKKEFREQIRTYKGLVFLVIFAIFGIMGPLLAKLMPEILSSLGTEGMMITLPGPTYLDSYGQFFKNLTQMGIVVLLLILSNLLSAEFSKGTLINILSKGLSRPIVIFSKFLSATVLWSLCLVVSALITFGYTQYLFGDHPLNNLLFSILCLWLFGLLIIGLILLFSTLLKKSYLVVLGTALVLIVLLTMMVFPQLAAFNPAALVSNNMALLTGDVLVEAMVKPVAITLILTIASLLGSCLIFKKSSIE